MEWAFNHMQASDGGSVYLRLTTRSLKQSDREDDAWKADALQGAYWLKAPTGNREAAIALTGAIVPEVMQAWDVLSEDIPGLGLLNVTSQDLLHRGWSQDSEAFCTAESQSNSNTEITLDQRS